MEYKQKNLQSHLKKLFWINTLSIIVVTIALMYIIGPFWGENIEPNVVFERYAIIVTLACIPLGLKLFHSAIKKIEREKDKDIYLNKYRKAFYTRFAIIDAAVIFNLIGFYLFESQNLILMAVICIFALFFCFPGKDSIGTVREEKEVETETDNNEDENIKN